MFVLSREEMTHLDQATMQGFNMSSELLMETAGKSSAEIIIKICEKKKLELPLLIACGVGNNGGDGFVIARWLSQNNYNCSLLIIGDPDKMTSETSKNYKRCQKMGIPLFLVQSANSLKDMNISNVILIDAVFGIGFRGELDNFYQEIFSFLQEQAKLVISIDIASGLNANTGNCSNSTIKADYTLTMAAPKYGHFLNKGKEYSGEISVIDLGIPNFIYRGYPPRALLNEDKGIKYPKRFANSHKGDYGKVAIFAGSEGLSGAAILASKACLRSGAGLISLYFPESLYHVFDGILIEVMKKSIKTVNAQIDEEFIINEIDKADVILIGPGISQNAFAESLLKCIIDHSGDKLIVIDADGLNILAKNKQLLKSLITKNVILTPHIVEFSRLIDTAPERISADPLIYLDSFLKNYNIPILLKSSVSLCAYKNDLHFISKGNDALSTGGSGDVLSGIISSFVAQNYCYYKKHAHEFPENYDMKDILFDSAVSGAYLLGISAENLCRKYASPAVTPSDIIEELFKK